jgi:hypothetical protein
LQHTQDDLQSSLDTYPFEDADLFHEDFHSSYSDFDRHQVVARPKHSKVHATKHKYFHVETFCGDLQIKKRRFLNLREEFSSRHEVVPYHISPCLGNQHVFLGSLILSQPSGISDFLSEDEDEPSFYIWYPSSEMD